MKALLDFATWLATYKHVDRNQKLPPGLRLTIHSRSDAHFVRLAELIMRDLLDACPVLGDQAARGEIAYGINYRFRWPNGKTKTLDLAIGIPAIKRDAPREGPIHRLRNRGGRETATPPEERFSRLLIACELKSVLTEHSKSQPRVFDELNGSHAIIHAGSRDTITAGITLINIASSFVSPLRQRPAQPIEVSYHEQPMDAAKMVTHLRGLPRRAALDRVGFDAYCSFVMDVDNQGQAALWTQPPAPQPGDPDHFDRFISDICRVYSEQFSDVDHLPEIDGLTPEEALSALARQYPGLLDSAGQLAVDADLTGAPELHAILKAIEAQARTE